MDATTCTNCSDELAARIATLTWRRPPPPMGVHEPAAAHLEGATSAEMCTVRDDLLRQIDEATTRR